MRLFAACRIVLCALLAGATAVPRPAPAQEPDREYDAWIVTRGDCASPPGCRMLVRSRSRGLAVLELAPIEGGGLGVYLMRADGPTQQPGPTARLGMRWLRTGPRAAFDYPLAGFTVRPSARAFVYMDVLLHRPEEVRRLIVAATGSRGVMLIPPGGMEVSFEAPNFSAAWSALKECDPALGAGLP